jgi:hypothetical protein
MVADLEKECGVKLPAANTFHTPEALKVFDDLCRKFDIECTPPRTTSRLLDKVILMKNNKNRLYFVAIKSFVILTLN